LLSIQTAVPPKNPRNRAGRRHRFLPLSPQPIPDLAPSPRILPAHPQDRRLHLRAGLFRTVVRTTRAILQASFSPLFIPLQPLVSRLRADAVTTAQLSNVGSLNPCQHHEFPSQRHSIPLLPGHAVAPPSKQQLPRKVLPMSPYRCYPCPRSI